jgi:signal-transduction protein with cAMP-binding, CBS, and nucleotidyltransferase domain
MGCDDKKGYYHQYQRHPGRCSRIDACASGGNTKKVKDAMSKPVITLDRSGSIFEACGLMKKHQIKKLVIMNGEQLEGVVTTSDLARLPLNISEGLNHLVSKLRELSL